ncbi:MAG: glycosyltransferase family 1 protein [Chloroflexi bacterium]|nr:MAG: glycosyltransferase family 1 protein [Chloroflexota bacterium]
MVDSPSEASVNRAGRWGSVVALNGHFLAHPATGSGQYVSHLIGATERLGGEVSLRPFLADHTTRPQPASFRTQPMLAPFPAAIATRRLPNDLRKVIWEQLIFPLAARRSGADCIHVPYFGSPVMTRGIPTVVTIHDLIPLVMPAYVTTPLVALYNRLVSAGARTATLVLADSEASRRDIIRLLGIAPDRVRKVYLGVDPHLGIPVPFNVRQAVRSKYGLPERFLLYLGGFDVRKNLTGLVDAIASMDRSTAVNLVIAGRVPQPGRRPTLFPDIRRRVNEAGMQATIHFPGFIDEEDKSALMQLATAFVFPSTYEGFGLDPLEALQAGTPVVCANRTSLPELMGDAAIMFDPDTPGELATILARIWRDEGLRTDLSRRGPRQAARFTWEECARQTSDAYKSAIDARTPRSVIGRAQ